MFLGAFILLMTFGGPMTFVLKPYAERRGLYHKTLLKNMYGDNKKQF